MNFPFRWEKRSLTIHVKLWINYNVISNPAQRSCSQVMPVHGSWEKDWCPCWGWCCVCHKVLTQICSTIWTGEENSSLWTQTLQRKLKQTSGHCSHYVNVICKPMLSFLSRVMESLNLIRYLALRDNILRDAVSQNNHDLTILFIGKTKKLFLIPAGRGVGRNMQTQRQISDNSAHVHQLIKNLLLCRSKVTERGPKTKSKG